MVDHQGVSPFVIICHFSSIAHMTYYSPLTSSAPHCVTHSTEATSYMLTLFCVHCQSWPLLLLAAYTDPNHAVPLLILRPCLGSSAHHLRAWAHASQLSLVSPLLSSKTSLRVTYNKHQPLSCTRNVFSQAKDTYPCRYAEPAFQ